MRLGMTKSTVAGIMAGVTPRMGRSPQNYESYVYNPNGDYTQLLEVQFKDGLVVEMSTISSDFSYGDQVKAGDNVSTLTANGYKANSTYKYKFYAKQTDSASVDVMTDICRGGEVYGIQIFDIDLGSLDRLLMPDKCIYNDDINKYQGKLASDYLKAYRIYHKIETEMEISDTGVAQTQAEYMAKVKKNTTSDVRGWTFDKRFEVDYGGMDEKEYDSNPSVTMLCCATEFASSNNPDAFSAVTYAIAISTSSSEFYKYILMEDIEINKDTYYCIPLDYKLKLECGFANGYAAFDFYGPWS